MKIIKLQIVYNDTSTEVSQVETQIKRVEGCHYKTHLASEVQRAWNCAEDLECNNLPRGITFLQIGSLPPSPPASPPSPSSGSLPFPDGEYRAFLPISARLQRSRRRGGSGQTGK